MRPHASVTRRPRPACGHDDIALQLRIRAEFAEMPGLNLTLSQASRLFHLQEVRCKQVLAALVEMGYLAMRDKTFVRRPSV
jgi:hypothetical protein